ncbi:M12 family metallo-peptidase [Cyanobium sp. FGCU-52]|nr:M12 family metallo-peptidase [Cyanobium sp. FGCU52]
MARKTRIASFKGLQQTLEATTTSSWSEVLPAATGKGRRAEAGGLALSASTLVAPPFSLSKPDRSIAISFDRKRSNEPAPAPLPTHPLQGRQQILETMARPFTPVVPNHAPEPPLSDALIHREKPGGTPASPVSQVILPTTAKAIAIANAVANAAETPTAAALTAPSLISTSALLDPSATFRLHSNPTATCTIYLDFNGHTTTGTTWNTSTMGASFFSPAYDIDGNRNAFSSAELTRIQQIWQRVAQDFAPFDVNVTTQALPTDSLIRSSSTDVAYGIRVVITSYGPSSSTAGGIASVGSFTASSDTPAFVYNKSVVAVAEAISHETSHTLGLSHDGTASATYYGGHGSGETSWAPIMGNSYSRNVTTWDNGSYYGSNNGTSSANYGRGADDLAVITTRNGFGYKLDLIGDSLANASPLTITAGSVTQYGTIETQLDTDWYSFQLLDTGNVDLSFNPYWLRSFVDGDDIWGGDKVSVIAPISDTNTSTPWPENGANLDLAVSLFNSTGQLLTSSNDPGLATRLAYASLSAGNYFLKLDGVGFGDPTKSSPTGYTDYASIGNYWISGTISQAADHTGPTGTGTPPLVPLPTLKVNDLRRLEGTSTTNSRFLVGVSLSGPSSTEVTVNYATADGTATSGSTGRDFVATTGTLRIAAGATSASIAVDVIADSTIEPDETFLLNIFNPTGATIADGQALITIANDDSSTTTTTTTKTSNGQAKGPALAQQLAAEAIDPVTGLGIADGLASPDGESHHLICDHLICDELPPEDAALAWIADPLPPLAGSGGPVAGARDAVPGLLAATPPWLQPATPLTSVL